MFFHVYNQVMKNHAQGIYLHRTVFVLAAFASSCSPDGAKIEPPAAASTTPAVSLPDTAVNASAPGDTAVRISSWTVTQHGIGPVRAGMSVDEVRSYVPALNTPADIASAGCTYARSPSLPSGAVLMFRNGTLTRVDILSGQVKSALGAGIGDTEDRVKSLYGDALKVSSHKYTDGHYLTVLPASTPDSLFRIVFETDGTRVIRYRSGRIPAVEYVEGCS